MGAFLAMRPGAALALMAAALLAGCGNSPDSRFADEVRGSVLTSLGALVAEAPPPPPEVTRAQMEAIGAPVIWARSALSPGGGGYVGLARNTGRLAYLNAARQRLTLHGAQLTEVRGVGTDLVGYRSDTAADPTVFIRPPADWPARVDRIYWFNDDLSGRFLRAAVCLPAVGAPTEIVIFGKPHAVVEIEEPCRTPRHAFVNRYWVDADSGFVWRSEQWAGPAFGSLTLEVVVPAAIAPVAD